MPGDCQGCALTRSPPLNPLPVGAGKNPSSWTRSYHPELVEGCPLNESLRVVHGADRALDALGLAGACRSRLVIHQRESHDCENYGKHGYRQVLKHRKFLVRNDTATMPRHAEPLVLTSHIRRGHSGRKPFVPTSAEGPGDEGRPRRGKLDAATARARDSAQSCHPEPGYPLAGEGGRTRGNR